MHVKWKHLPFHEGNLVVETHNLSLNYYYKMCLKDQLALTWLKHFQDSTHTHGGGGTYTGPELTKRLSKYIAYCYFYWLLSRSGRYVPVAENTMNLRNTSQIPLSWN